jgi:hypothetical protein
MRIEALGFRAIKLAQQKIESLLDAFAFALLFVQRVDELADQRVQRGHIIGQRRAFA